MKGLKLALEEVEDEEAEEEEKSCISSVSFFFLLFSNDFLLLTDQTVSFCMKCISYWPEDGRPYVALGKILNKQSKTAEARAVYEKGCQATHGENAYIWQVSN